MMYCELKPMLNVIENCEDGIEIGHLKFTLIFHLLVCHILKYSPGQTDFSTPTTRDIRGFFLEIKFGSLAAWLITLI